MTEELALVPKGGVVLGLGFIAHQAVLRAFSLKLSSFRFSHGAMFQLPGNRWLLDSYHCSRYNTQTKRLTEEMFQRVLIRAKNLAFA